ncbi:MAG: ribonuclease [Clostridia bacterium]|nr:ribonuclease [Clostridia bacterium]
MKTVKAGTATMNGRDGADWHLKNHEKLPDYYITADQAKELGWIPILGNLASACKGKMIFGGIYQNRNGHLPKASDRIWYEADINYRFGYRNQQRVLYSNDGLLFVTFDHYQTFFEIA